MRKFTNHAILIIGIVIATLTILTNLSIADSKSSGELEKEQYRLVESLVNQIEQEKNTTRIENNLYKVYNKENNLVFETRNSNDQKLRNLLDKSDLLITIDNISYYKLSH